MERIQSKGDFSIDAKPLSVGKLFDDFYAVPDFQREYVWQNENVVQLLEDVCDGLYDENGSLILNAEYFIGSLVLYQDEEGIFQLIDGQQRATTLFIILCVLRERLPMLKTLPPLIEHMKMNPETAVEEPLYRVRLLYQDAIGALEKIATHDKPGLEALEQTTSVKNLHAAYEAAHEFLTERFSNDTKKWSLFFMHFTERVKLIRVLTPSQIGALRVFETINSTGVGLTPMDLLKNLLFRKVKATDFAKVTANWKIVTDEVAAAGETNSLRFLRYFVLSRYNDTKTAKPVAEDQLYSWLSKNAVEVGMEAKPLAFLKDLVNDAKLYRQLTQARDVQGRENRFLRNIQVVSRRAKQHFILLLAGQRLDPALFNRLCQAIENLFFAFILTKEATGAFETVFYKAAEPLRNLKPDDLPGLETFIQKWLQPEIDTRADRLQFALETMRIGSLQKYRLRYLLAKLSQYVDENAWGNSASTELSGYTGKIVHVEHILPDTPTAELKAQFDKPTEYEDYASRLGNLTLLEMSINTSIQQNFFAEKAVEYQKSNLLLTKTIGVPFKIGANTQPNRVTAPLQTWQHWDSEAIRSRQRMLVKLAWQVWGITAALGQSHPDVLPTPALTKPSESSKLE